MRFENIQAAVQIVIADAHAHAGLLHAVFIQRDAAFEAHLGERAVVIVPEQEAGRGIASHVDVGPAVVIEIGRNRGHAVTAFRLGNARFLADIGERAVAVVVIETRRGREASRADRN